MTEIIPDDVMEVAKAICKADGYDPERNNLFVPPYGAEREAMKNWRAYEDQASAAIAVMDQHKAAIAVEIVNALEKLNAPVELLSTVGSLGDTLSDQQVLDHLRAFNRKGTIFSEVLCEVGK